MNVIACLAVSLDGKLGPAQRVPYTRMSSDADLDHLFALRDTVDAIVFGAETFRAYPRPHRGKNRIDLPLHCILTKSFNLPPAATYFKNHPPVPTLIVSPNVASQAIRAQYPDHVQWYPMSQDQPITQLLNYLSSMGMQRVLVEGGSEILSMFLAEALLNELYLTVCPVVIADDHAPGLVTGMSALVGRNPQQPPRLLSVKRVGDEVFLHYQWPERSSPDA